MVRIPNSTIINANLTNNSYHASRRLTLSVSVGYDADMEKALEALSKAPSLCPTVLNEPAPAVWFDGFGDSGINMTVAVWFASADFLKTKNDFKECLSNKIFKRYVVLSNRNGPMTFEGIFDENLKCIWIS